MSEARTLYLSAPSFLAETGLVPVTKASGRMRQVRFRCAANGRMRHAFDWCMFVALHEDPWSADIYQQARDAGPPHHGAWLCAAPAPAGSAFRALLARPHHLRPGRSSPHDRGLTNRTPSPRWSKPASRGDPTRARPKVDSGSLDHLPTWPGSAHRHDLRARTSATFTCAPFPKRPCRGDHRRGAETEKRTESRRQ